MTKVRVHFTHVRSAGVSSALSRACSSFNSWLLFPVLCTLYGNTGLAILRILPTRTNSSNPSSSNLYNKQISQVHFTQQLL